MAVKRTDDATNDESVRSDGGQAEIPLTRISDEEVTINDRLAERFSRYWATFLIAWSDWRTRIGLTILMGYVLMGTVGVYLLESPNITDGPKWGQPFENMAYPLGTNQYGEGILKMIVHSTPDMFMMILGGAVFATGVGAVIGILSGYKGGMTDEVLMTLTDTAMMIPGLPLIIVVSAIFEPTNPFIVGILISINAWAGGARTLRSQVLTIREESYVEASRLMGVPLPSILSRDITPQLLPLILVGFVSAARGVIFNSVALYFLGVLPFTTSNWGVMMNLAYEAGAVTTPSIFYTIFFPLLVIVLLSWGLIMLVQGLDRVVNVRVRARHQEEEIAQE